jgi:hypothetical protein
LNVAKRFVGEMVEPAGCGICFNLPIPGSVIKLGEPIAEVCKLSRRKMADCVLYFLHGAHWDDALTTKKICPAELYHTAELRWTMRIPSFLGRFKARFTE